MISAIYMHHVLLQQLQKRRKQLVQDPNTTTRDADFNKRQSTDSQLR